MTSKLKCPFCQHKLYQTASEPATYCCLYKDCTSNFKFAGSKELWQALIQAKQDLEKAKADIEDYKKHKALWEQIRNNTILELERKLETAREALEEIKRVCDGCRWCESNIYTPDSHDGRIIAETTNKALEQIEHKD